MTGIYPLKETDDRKPVTCNK